MALLHPIELARTGATASYWRITHIQVDCEAGVTDVQLHGYLDEAARRTGRSPLHHIPFRFGTDDLADPQTIAVADLYRAIREAPGEPDATGTPMPSRFRDAADA